MNTPLNRSEKFVAQVSARSFLTFWCYEVEIRKAEAYDRLTGQCSAKAV